MVTDRLIDVIGVGGPPAVFAVTVGGGLAAKAGWLTVRRRTEALVAPGTYLRLAVILVVAAVAVVVAAARGLVDGDAAIQSVYALLLANLLEQLARLALD